MKIQHASNAPALRFGAGVNLKRRNNSARQLDATSRCPPATIEFE